MGLASELKAFAKGREKAYRFKNRMNDSKAKAIGNILRVTEHFKEAKSDGWVSQIRQDLLLILPSEEGRFAKQREKILSLIS